MAKRSDNPLCLACGKPTKTISHTCTSQVGHVISRRYVTTCYRTCNEGQKFRGEGDSIRAARDDYGRKFDDDYNPL